MRPFSRFFRNSPTAEYPFRGRMPARDTTAPYAGRQPRPRNGRRRSGVRRFAYAEPKVFCAIGTGGASGNALRMSRSPPPLQRSFNGLIISFPKISGIWGFLKFSFIFPKSNFAIMHAAPGGENFGTAPAAVRGMRRALIAPGAWWERRPKRRILCGSRAVSGGFSAKPLHGALRSRFFREAAVRFPPAFRPEEKIRKICLQFM